MKEQNTFKSSTDVIAAIRKKYPTPAYAVIEEVGNSTGFNCRRHADLIVMSLWPSRGLEVIGIEVKVSRHDWMRELVNPEKADVIHKYCDRWYLAVGDGAIVQPGELPKGWGLMVPGKEGAVKISIESDRAESPKLDRGFIAAVLRKATEQLAPEAQLSGEFNRGYKDGRAECEKSHNYTLGAAVDELARLKKTITAFEKSSGVEIQNAWVGDKIGEAVRQVINGMHLRQRESLLDLKQRCLKVADYIDTELKANELLDGKP